MSDERMKTNKQSTGTVPKVKYRINASRSLNERERSRGLTNNLASYWHHPPDPSNIIRNPRRNQRNNYIAMDTTLEEPILQSVQNGSINYNQNTNGSITPNTSSSSSRRNSSGSTLKCDNVTKYPDKKQIEDKLHQIREYLKITNSLMNSMKNSEDPTNDEAEKESLEKMLNNLRDSEKKLVDILDQMNSNEREENQNEQLTENGVDNLSEYGTSSFRKNDIDVNLDSTNQEIDALKDQQMALMHLQQKAENKLRDARQIQGKLLTAQYGNDVNNTNNRKGMKNYSDFDVAIKELEERAKRLRPPQISNQRAEDNILAKVESLHNQIVSMHNANDEREQLIETLDNRDAELRTQHAELQNRLIELQNKKMQVDHLVTQLQSFGDEDEEDVGGQVRKIVTMKDQLKKLQDMLEIVKTTENIMQNTNASAEAQAAACEICLTAESFLEKDVQKSKLQSHVQNESNVLRYDNDTSLASDNQCKEVNKKIRDQNGRGVKPKIFSISEKLALQAELEAKKRELEEIMGKHKASSSNLNHDVGMDVKSEFSCTSNIVNEAWMPLIPPQNRCGESDRFSSDDCQDEINDYSELQDNHNILTLPTSNVPSNTSKFRLENTPRGDYIHSSEFERSRGLSHTPDRNIRSSSVATSGYVREQPRSNSEHDNRTQVQKQLQLIKSVCDSMLEQQTANSQSNVQQLRNNLTPSPLYSEPRRFASPNPHVMNALNIANPTTDMPWLPGNNMHGNLNSDANNYQNWLATNTLQTQSFMLNTLNQCCQMLWLQQRELVSLRNSVMLLQERLENSPYGGTQDHLASSFQSANQDQRSSTQYRPVPNQKVNHVSAAFSLPNLNQYNTPPSNLDPNYINQNNVQSGRLIDPCLNNVNVNHLNTTQSIDHPNNVLHGVNSNINHTLPNQMWNGQALNNQVAPGNRANNYWDNFRSNKYKDPSYTSNVHFSYSRQNLLSTKNSEVLQNPHSSLDRSNVVIERTNPFSLMSFSKSNSEQDSASTSQENTPQRRGPFRSIRHENTNTAVIPPPDVLNVNHNITKINEQLDLSSPGVQHNHEDINLGFQMLLNLNTYNDTCSNHSNTSEEQIPKECIPEQPTRRNEWKDDVPEEHLPKTKLFDELRENVYKEVASLISANEARPHFLIQLFRDLQMIGSDSLRLKILQSVQTVITHSLMPSQNSTRLPMDSQQMSSNHEFSQTPECYSLQSTVWSKPTKNVCGVRTTMASGNVVENTFKGALSFLNDHEDEIIDCTLLASFKQILLGSETFKETVKDTVFQKHFANVLDEVLEQYRGKKVCDVKMYLTQTLNELLCGELSFIELIQETNPDNCFTHGNNIESASRSFTPGPIYEFQNNNGKQVVDSNIQNGDLAEADQSRVIHEDIEEEGAVGGILETTNAVESITATQSAGEDTDLEKIDFPCNVEGLDQVPTRLPIKVKSRSTTPITDRSNSQAQPDAF